VLFKLEQTIEPPPGRSFSMLRDYFFDVAATLLARRGNGTHSNYSFPESAAVKSYHHGESGDILRSMRKLMLLLAALSLLPMMTFSQGLPGGLERSVPAA
jgi:hypothetical protein